MIGTAFFSHIFQILLYYETIPICAIRIKCTLHIRMMNYYKKNVSCRLQA